jgi:hypothetical protein
MDLAPFREGGEYANLARETKIDLSESDVLYLDMQQIEGKQKTGLMLQLVLRSVYERAKQTDKKVIFAIDEAHYLMQNEASLSFLERATRHARHYDLSLQLITQTVDEFFTRADTDELAQKSKAIADNCALKIFHHVEGLSDSNAEEWLSLSPPEAEFIRNAKPGSDEYGYSQALIEVGEAGRYPINVSALPEEKSLITDASVNRSSEWDNGEVDGDHVPAKTAKSAPGPADSGRGSEDTGREGERNSRISYSSRRSGVGLDQPEYESLLGDIDPVRLLDFLNEDEVSDLADTTGTDHHE